jgi:hypothetical protein
LKNALFAINSQPSAGFSIVILCEALVLLRGALFAGSKGASRLEQITCLLRLPAFSLA